MRKIEKTMAMMSNNLELFNKTIQKARSITICSHINPDGDAVGSSIGLYLALKDLGKEVYLIKNDGFPTNLTFMKDEFFGEEDIYLDKAIKSDLFIVTDVASKERIGSGIDFFNLSSDSLCIDHHKTNSGFCRNNIIEPHMSSTCELIAGLLIDGGYKISNDTASFLYLGISTDTNRFLYESSSADTLKIAAHLLEKGANKPLIHNNLYEREDPNYISLQAEVINDAKIFKSDKFILARITKEQLERYNLDFDHIEGLVSILKSLDGVELSCLVKEDRTDYQKVSFRSKNHIDVAELALEYGGGGHKRAAGCTIKGSNDEVFDLLYKRLHDL